MKLEEIKDIAVNAALEAGNFLIKNKDNEKKIFSEIGRDIKLEIDRETENIIRRKLSSTSYPILGEEFGLDKEISDFYWVIDPIDGTANYFRGLDQSCVSIALMHKNDCKIGVIYNFNNNEIYSAIEGCGAYLNNEKIQVSNISNKSEASLSTGFPASETVESSINFLEDLKAWKKVRMFGSAALSCAYVASGKCDHYAEKGVFLWDFAAGICLVREAGGNVIYSLIDKERYEVVFSNGRI